SYLWVPIVPAEERASFEEAARREGLADFAIWERSAQWELVPASPREVYYPVSYAEPMPEGDPKLGYDLGSEPFCRAALEEALQTGLPTASAPLTLLYGSSKEPGILIVQPVSSGGWQGTGLVVGVLRLQGLLEHVLHLHQEVPPWLGVGLVKVEPPQGISVLAVHPKEHLADLPTITARMQLSGPLHTVRPLFISGQVFAFTACPTSAFEALQPRRAPWLIGLTGLSLTAIAAVLAATFYRRQRTLEEQVLSRTLALEAERDRAQAYLDVAGVILLHLDCEGRVTLINRRGLEILGCTEEEVIVKV
ncbi:MAG: CHASE domain-containing protein, partial [Chloroflexi bacterium]|nr:CHASE domain-containing protein [Chloroflexota bacterium]